MGCDLGMVSAKAVILEGEDIADIAAGICNHTARYILALFAADKR